MWPWKETMNCCCCTELLFVRDIKPRLDAIDAQLELLIQAQERMNREAQAKIDAATVSIGGGADALDSLQK